MNNLVKCSNNGLFCNDALQALGTAIPVYKISVETGKIMVSKSEVDGLLYVGAIGGAVLR